MSSKQQLKRKVDTGGVGGRGDKDHHTPNHTHIKKHKSNHHATAISTNSATTTSAVSPITASSTTLFQKKGFKPRGGFSAAARWQSKPKAKKKTIFSRAERKNLRKERRQQKPHASLIDDANQLYRHGFTHLSSTERAAKIDTILTQTHTHMITLLAKHDTSRVYQLCMKYATPAQRERMFTLCQSHFYQLILDHYAHHFLLKLLQYYPTPQVRQTLIQECRIHWESIVSHADASVVYDYLYASEKNKHKQQLLLAELYHPSFSLFHADTLEHKKLTDYTLSSILSAYPDLTSSILQRLSAMIEKWIQKDMLQFRFVQHILYQYLSLTTSQVNYSNRIELLTSVSLSNVLTMLLENGDGVHLLSMMVLYGSAKERKMVLKVLKSRVCEVIQAKTTTGQWLIMRILHIVDDTIAVQSSIWSEVVANRDVLTSLIQDTHGAKVIQYALNPQAASTYLSPAEAAFVQVDTVDTGNVEQSQPQPVSKKDPIIRQQEHLAYILLPLLSLFTDNEQPQQHHHQTLSVLLRHTTASPVLYEILHTSQSILDMPESAIKAPALVKQLPDIRNKVQTALQTLVKVLLDIKGQEEAGQQPEELSSLLEDRAAHYTYKRLLSIPANTNSTTTSTTPAEQHQLSPLSLSLASSLLSTLHPSFLSSSLLTPLMSATLSSNRGCFVVLAMLKALDTSMQHRVRKLLQQKKHRQLLIERRAAAATTGLPNTETAEVLMNGKKENKKKQDGAAAAAMDGEAEKAPGVNQPSAGRELLLTWLDEKTSEASSSAEPAHVPLRAAEDALVATSSRAAAAVTDAAASQARSANVLLRRQSTRVRKPVA